MHAGSSVAAGDSDHEIEFSDSDREPPPSEELISYLLELHDERVLNARQTCRLLRLAGESGVPGASRYGFRDGAPSGHYSRKMGNSLGDDSSEFYDVDVPVYAKHSANRSIRTFKFYPPHECVADDITFSASLFQLREMRASNQLPPSYYSHKVVREAGAGVDVMPYAVYLDGVPYSQVDSITGFWLVHLVTDARFCFCLFRKRLSCLCGCRGWCSFHAILSWINWSLTALTEGLVCPLMRHDGQCWRENDSVRKLSAGVRIAVRAAILFIKGDWMEYATSLGLPTWRDGIRPCFACNETPQGMYDYSKVSDAGMSSRLNQLGDYDAACARCELHVTLQPDQRDMLSKILRFDKRDDGNHGRCLIEDVHCLGLREGDRLEPSIGLMDVHRFETVDVFPLSVCFWRSANESMSRRRNPLFNSVLGIDPACVLCIDILHCFHLGILLQYTKAALWHLLLSGLFYAKIGTQSEQIQNAVLGLRHDIHIFYGEYHRHHTDQLTRISDLTVSMLGSRDAQLLKTKAAETYGLSKYVLRTLHLHAGRLGNSGARFLSAGKPMERLLEIFQEKCFRMSDAAIEECA